MLVPSVKNIIFDLGGVILDLSVDHTLNAFAELSRMPKDAVHDLYFSAPGFLEYEKGLIDDRQFRDYVRATYALSATDEAIDDAWNAMLRGIPQLKLELLKKLQGEFRVFLLSNTNAIHLHYINGHMMPANESLDDYFYKAYYSHQMGKRKPDTEIFEQVLDENHLLPEQTLFLDDYAVNIEGAKTLGIKTIHVTTPNLILDYFHA